MSEPGHFNPMSTFVLGCVSLALLISIFAAALAGVYLTDQHATQSNLKAEQAQGLREQARICRTLDALAALQPPKGNAAVNPSRAYEQQFHKTIDQLRPDLGCTQLRS